MDIASLKTALSKAPASGIALDIDETLTPTNFYWIQLLSKKFGRPDHLTDREIISQYRYIQNVPVWQTPEVFSYMESLRTSNDIQQALPLMDNALQEVRRIHTILPIVAYITARPETVLYGTERWLAHHGFPPAPVLLRPSTVPHDQGPQWKARVLADLHPFVQGIIDDNDGLLTHLPSDYPGFIILYDHTKAPHSPLRVACAPSWSDVLPALEQFL